MWFGYMHASHSTTIRFIGSPTFGISGGGHYKILFRIPASHSDMHSVYGGFVLICSNSDGNLSCRICLEHRTNQNRLGGEPAFCQPPFCKFHLSIGRRHSNKHSCMGRGRPCRTNEMDRVCLSLLALQAENLQVCSHLACLVDLFQQES